MARTNFGSSGPYSGKIGATIAYIVNGKTRIRAAQHASHKPRSEKQLAMQQRMSVISPLVNCLKMYLRVGFALAAKKEGNFPCHAAKSYNLKHAIKGVYPNQEIDYAAVRLTEGDLALPLNPMVESTDIGFKFSWDFVLNTSNGSPYDRTMLLAWFPEQELYFQVIDGATRDRKEDFLWVSTSLKGQVAETYISFVTDDRSQISNSVYTGRIEF